MTVLQIDELVLTGFADVDRAELVDGIQSELTRLLSERGPDAARGDSELLDAGSFTVAAAARPRDVAARAAAAIHAQVTA